VCRYDFGPATSKSDPLVVRGTVVDSARASRPARLSIVKASDAERGGGRKLLLAFVTEGLAPGSYRLVVSVSDPASKASGEAGSPFEIIPR